MVTKKVKQTNKREFPFNMKINHENKNKLRKLEKFNNQQEIPPLKQAIKYIFNC